MSLEKENYDKFMGEATKRETERKIKIIDTYPIFSKFVRKVKQDLIHYLIFEDKKVNHIIFKERDPIEYVYFIIEGRFEVTKSIY